MDRPLTERDRELLLFLAEHRLVLATHVETLFGVSADAAERRLRALAQQGYLSRRRIFFGQPPCCHIRARGLAAVGSELPAPRLNLVNYEHDVGVAWIWLAAKRGTFGPLREVIGERRMRSHDGRLNAEQLTPNPALAGANALADSAWRSGQPLAVRLGPAGRSGRDRLHYPDLLLRTSDGKRIAIELELSSKGRARLEGILLGYASDRRIDGVLYLVEDRPAGRTVGETVRSSARRLGIEDLIAVRRLRVNDGRTTGGIADRGREASRGREPGRGRDHGRHRAPMELGM